MPHWKVGTPGSYNLADKKARKKGTGEKKADKKKRQSGFKKKKKGRPSTVVKTGSARKELPCPDIPRRTWRLLTSRSQRRAGPRPELPGSLGSPA